MRGVEEGGEGGGVRGGGGVSEELQWTALQRTTAQTEEEQVRAEIERNQNGQKGGNCERIFHHKYGETQSRSFKRNKNDEMGAFFFHAKTVRHVASSKWKGKKKS